MWVWVRDLSIRINPPSAYTKKWVRNFSLSLSLSLSLSSPYSSIASSGEESQTNPPLHSHSCHTPIQVHLSVCLSKCQSSWVRVRFVCNKQKVLLFSFSSLHSYEFLSRNHSSTWYSKHQAFGARGATEFLALTHWERVELNKPQAKFAHPFVSVNGEAHTEVPLSQCEWLKRLYLTRHSLNVLWSIFQSRRTWASRCNLHGQVLYV